MADEENTTKGPTMDPRLAERFASGDTGISSECIALWLSAKVKLTRWGDGTPSDGADFGRCYRLLQRFPEWRARLPEMAERGGKWPALVESWDDIQALYLREITKAPGAAGSTYKLMKEVRGEATSRLNVEDAA